MTELTCPKCQSVMRSYERSGVTVDQCTGCNGIFLDRGELERLVAAEDTHYGAPAGQYPSGRGGFLDQLLGGGGGGYRRRGHDD